MAFYGKDDDDTWHTDDGTFQGRSLPSHMIGKPAEIAAERERRGFRMSNMSNTPPEEQLTKQELDAWLGNEPVDATTKMALLRTYPILQYFTYDHLPPHLQEASKPCAAIAWRSAEAVLGFHPEVEAGLRKLLEAKDCFVRSQVRR